MPDCPEWLHHHHDAGCDGEPTYLIVRFTPREMTLLAGYRFRGQTGLLDIGGTVFNIRAAYEYKDPWEYRAEMKWHPPT